VTSFDPPSPARETVASPSPFTAPTNSAATNDAVPASAVPTTSAGPTSEVLPTMSDLDRLSASLDQVDRTLAELDGLPGLTPA